MVEEDLRHELERASSCRPRSGAKRLIVVSIFGSCSSLCGVSEPGSSLLSREANVEGFRRNVSRLSPALANLLRRGLSASWGGSPHRSAESFQ